MLSKRDRWISQFSLKIRNCNVCHKAQPKNFFATLIVVNSAAMATVEKAWPSSSSDDRKQFLGGWNPL